MIKTIVGDITTIECVDYIVNAANGIGPMGRGVAGAIRRAGGKDVEKDAFRVCKKEDPQVGEVYVTTAGKMPYKAVIHVVTMKTPGGPTSYQIVRDGLQNLIIHCRLNGIDKIALPAFGTGVGGLDKKMVAEIFIEELRVLEDILFYVVDPDIEFITYVNSL